MKTVKYIRAYYIEDLYPLYNEVVLQKLRDNEIRIKLKPAKRLWS